ncbi:MAG: hypothetical protein EPN60_04945 [Nevskiaceae bacterium]|nr:MAG: hypothetical protein EPO48_09325 [Nevskiaceae bacterium]TAM30702.1 MAG: hypothetical protein EPN60_04945 [Nevskiaceae bacterium]
MGFNTNWDLSRPGVHGSRPGRLDWCRCHTLFECVAMKSSSLSLRALSLALLAAGSLFGLSACGGGGSDPATLQMIEINPLDGSLPAGTELQLSATAIFSDNSKGDATAATAWQSSDTSIVTVNSSGVAHGVKQGSVTVSASFQGKTASTTLTVTAAVARSLAITPANPSVPKGSSLQFTATATFSDDSAHDVTTMSSWSSAASSIAAVSNNSGSIGKATGVSQGMTTIGASFSGVSSSTTIQVTAATLSSIQVTPPDSSLAKGTTKQYTATGIYTDNTTRNLTSSATWASGNTSVATVGNASTDKGLVKGVELGDTTLQASVGGVSGATNVTVSAASLSAIQVTPANASVPKGTTQQYTATGTFSDGTTQDVTASVTWASSAANIATISNASGSSGLATASAEGNTTISATSGEVSANAAMQVTTAVLSSIQVTPTAPTVPAGKTQQFSATGIYSDNSTKDLTTSVTWSTSNSAIMDVSNGSGQQGLAAANQPGTATISAALQGKSGSTVATVTDAVLTSIQVTPSGKTLARGFSLQFTATGIYSDNSSSDVTSSVTWSSSNTPAVTIANADGSRGLATADKTNTGSATIKATSGSISGSTTLTVTNATLSSVAVTPTNPSIPVGTAGQQMTATGTFSDSSTQDLTTQSSWTSSDTSKATISNSAGSQGFVAPVAQGSSTITATISNSTTSGKAGTTTATIVEPTLTSIAVTPADKSLPKGSTQQYQADGTYSDNSTRDITASVTWASSDTGAATISNQSDSKGLATSVAPGSTRISATLGGIAGETGLTTTAAALQSITISATPDNSSIAAGRSKQYTASGTYTDETTATITTSVTWASSDTSVATISNASGSNGLATSSTKGSTDITAKSSGVTSNTLTLTVTDKVPTAIDVTPKNVTIGNATTQQYKAMETYSDGSETDVTTTTSWSSSNSAVADISNANGTRGQATAKSKGTTTITATDPNATSITGSTGLTVGDAALTSITVQRLIAGQPENSAGSVPVSYKVQYKAIGNYADSTQQDLTESASWSTFNSGVATVSATAGSRGLVTAVALGNTTVQASFGGVSAQLGIAVTGATLSAIAVTPTGKTINNSCTLQMYATATYSDGAKSDIGTNNSVTWASSSSPVVSVDQTGLATGGSLPGSVNVSATKGSVTGQTAVAHSFAASCSNQ